MEIGSFYPKLKQPAEFGRLLSVISPGEFLPAALLHGDNVVACAAVGGMEAKFKIPVVSGYTAGNLGGIFASLYKAKRHAAHWASTLVLHVAVNSNGELLCHAEVYMDTAVTGDTNWLTGGAVHMHMLFHFDDHLSLILPCIPPHKADFAGHHTRGSCAGIFPVLCRNAKSI